MMGEISEEGVDESTAVVRGRKATLGLQAQMFRQVCSVYFTGIERELRAAHMQPWSRDV